jgi:hypothetical protein
VIRRKDGGGSLDGRPMLGRGDDHWGVMLERTGPFGHSLVAGIHCDVMGCA